MEFPDDLKYTREHEWARLEGDNEIVVGITDYAQDALGDVVYVELPEEGTAVEKEEPFGSIESVKAVSDLYSPATGTVVETNDPLAENPELVNEDCYGDAWMVRIRVNDPGDLGDLMSAAEYQEYIKETE